MTRPRRWRHVTIAASVALFAAATAACSGSDKAAPSPSTTSTPAPSPSSTPSGPVLAPLTGGPVLAVKIDNTPRSRPRIGLNRADVVYVEPVEGGLTRLLAVFTSHLPPEVGPVRSARESDVELLANYGPVAFAYSGGSSYTLKLLPRGTQVNLSFDASSRGFHRDRSRPAPYNVVGNTAELLRRAGGSAKPSDPGFRFGAVAPAGTPGTSVSARWASARMSLAWNVKRGQYLVTTDGQPDVGSDGIQHAAATVVLQQVKTRASANRDVNGQATPVVQLTGSGKVTLLRGGRSWSGAWARPSSAAPTSFTVGGKPFAMAPGGPVWVLLVAPGQSLQVH